MVTRRSLLAASALILGGSAAFAAAPAPFDEAAFDAAQKAGRPVLVTISAPWCPICKVQKPILLKLGTGPRFSDLAIFEIDFDTQKALVRRFNARSQSTLIAFKGKDEVGRSVGETQPEWIESFLEKTL
ncbi:thioredoxin family protein [Methylobacterium sp. C25]|uniref:thioredoxin family protein n=1 Tax=Methylobacterium sp. C25 TaxID=2721622 RepID=UPI001F158DE4|nr:thioredoxin family protein [Methylobacterium sp. C25]MCE4223693.1 thioredoxin family protein [Methylobacterium sp. C25]